MVLDGFMRVVDPQGPGDLRQTFQKGAVHRGENAGQAAELVRMGDRLKLLAELLDDLKHSVTVEDGRGLRQTAQGGPWNAELFLNLLEFAGLLKGPQGRADRIEHIQQEQRDVLIHVKASVADKVSLASNVTKRLQHGRNGLEILEALKFVFSYFMPFVAHERHLSKGINSAQV